MYKYETHLHTYPVSRCAKPNATVRDALEGYRELGYDGVFITNHFLDANINIDKSKPYEEKIEFYFSDYENGMKIGKEIGIKVFVGVEMSYHGADFLVYGLDKEWYLAHPEIMEMQYREKLDFLRDNGACVVQAHPFREAAYIDHVRLFPRSVDAVEVINAGSREAENSIAALYAEHYDLFAVAGTDNHAGKNQTRFAGVQTEEPVFCVQDYIRMIKERKLEIFTYKKEAEA